MYLFIDTLSEPSILLLFSPSRSIVSKKEWIGKQKEFDTLPEQIDAILAENKITYTELNGIVVVVGPGSFTGTRITTLVTNTLAMSFGKDIFPLTVSDIFFGQNAPLPWIVPITKKEVLLWNTKDNFSLLPLSLLPPGSYSTLGGIDLENREYTMHTARDYKKIIESINLDSPKKRIQPIYGKEPNITMQ